MKQDDIAEAFDVLKRELEQKQDEIVLLRDELRRLCLRVADISISPVEVTRMLARASELIREEMS